MKIYFITIFFILLFGIDSVGQDITWLKSVKGSGNAVPGKSVIDSQGNVYVLGFYNGIINIDGTQLTAVGSDDVFLLKYNASGTFQWIRSLGSTAQDIATSIAISKSGTHIYIGGMFSGSCSVVAPNKTVSLTSSGGYDSFISKYDGNGNLIWAKNVITGSNALNQRINAIKVDNNENLVCVGHFYGNGNFGNVNLSTSKAIAMFYAKYDSAGINLSASKIESSSNLSRFYDLELIGNDNYVVSYFTDSIFLGKDTLKSLSSTNDMLLIKFNGSGNVAWFRRISGTGQDYVTSISIEKTNLYLGGYTNSAALSVDSTKTVKSNKTYVPYGGYDVFFAKYDTTGRLEWFNSAGSTGDDQFYRALISNNTFVVAGAYQGSLNFNNKQITSKGSSDMFCLVHDYNDNLKYMVSVGGTGADIGETSLIDANGNFFLIGDYTSTNFTVGSNTIVNGGGKDFLIAKYDKASLSKVVTQITCSGAATGEIDVTPEGAVVPPYTYQWTKKGSSFTASENILTDLTAGTYYVTFTDAVGYTKMDSVVLTDPDPLVVTERVHTNATCYNATNAVLKPRVTGGTGTRSFVWSGSGAGVLATDSIQTALSAGTYNVTVTDEEGCTANLQNMVITQPARIVFKNTVVTKINGQLGAVDLTVTGGTPAYGYVWTGPTGFTSVTTQDISGLNIAGNYNVTVTDQNSCTGDTSVIIVDSNNLYAFISSKTNVSCKGGSNGSITVEGDTPDSNPSFTYSWTGPNSFTASSATINSLVAGYYSVTVTDVTPVPDKIYVISNIQITEPVNALVVSASSTNISCNGKVDGFVDANPTGGTLPYTYTWSKDAVNSGLTAEVIFGQTAGTYAVTVTDANNCTGSASSIITEPATLSISGVASTSVTCYGGKNDGTLTLAVAGGTPAYKYRWSNGLTTASISLLSAGSYRCTVSDANRCATTTQQIVSQPDAITASVSIANIVCYGGNNGAINLTPNGGNAGGYTYLWSNSATTEDLGSLVAGTYDVTITDSKACENSFSATVTQPADIVLAASSLVDVNCYGKANGSISLSTTGGTTPYVWVWSGGKTGGTVTGLSAGTYTVTVNDINSCNKSASFTITQPTELMISEDPSAHTDNICNGASLGALAIIASGSSGTYEYSIDGATWQSSASFTHLVSESYAVEVRDQSVTTCTKTLSPAIVITQPDAITFADPDVTDITCHGLTDGSIHASANGGTGTLTYLLKLEGSDSGNSTGTANGTFSGLTAGTSYVVEVTDANACGPVATAELTVTEPDAITITSQLATNTSGAGKSDGSVTVIATGGTGTLSYLLNGSTSQNTGLYQGLVKGKYTVTVNDVNSCGPVTSDELTVEDPTGISIINNAEVSLYPNPATDKVKLEIPGLKAQSLKIEIRSLTGVASMIQAYKDVDRDFVENFDLSMLPKGVYVIVINGTALKDKLIVQ